MFLKNGLCTLGVRKLDIKLEGDQPPNPHVLIVGRLKIITMFPTCHCSEVEQRSNSINRIS